MVFNVTLTEEKQYDKKENYLNSKKYNNMMKKSTLIFSIIIFTCVTSPLLTLALAQQSTIYKNSRSLSNLSDIKTYTYSPRFMHSIPFFPSYNDIDDDAVFIPTDVALNDDAFHNSNELQYTEWWYFDAEFSNNYTMQFSIHVYNIVTISFIAVNYDVYHYGKSISEHRTIYPLSAFNLSSEEPDIFLKDTTLQMVGFLGPQQDKLYYHISYCIENSSMDLYYEGMTEGWKGTTTAGNWAVMLPKASVTGTLIVNDTRMKVNGLGYHDHNWNVTVSAGLNFGWIWGKTNSGTYTLTWADILTTWFNGNPLLVVNKEFDGYSSIPHENITFSVTEMAFKDGMIIPYGFSLVGETENIAINITISVIDSDHTTILGIINYWRYHVHTQGTIVFHRVRETIDDYDIAEFIRFRFY